MINSPLSFTLLAAVWLFFALDVLWSKASYRHEQNSPFNFFNSMPFELSQGAAKVYLPFHYAFSLAAALSFMIFPFVVLPQGSQTFYYAIILYVMMGLSGLTMFSLFIITMNNYRLHVLALAILIATTIGQSVGLFLYMFYSPFDFYPLPLALLALLPGISALGLGLNPRLGKWPIMDKRELQDGTIQILRPPFFVLAYTEWALIITNLVFILYFFVVSVL